MEMEVDEILRDVETGHFLDFEENGFAVLRLVERGVIVGNVGGVGEMRLAPGGEFEGGVTGMDVDMGGSFF